MVSATPSKRNMFRLKEVCAWDQLKFSDVEAQSV